jgi:hypothetical protein
MPTKRELQRTIDNLRKRLDDIEEGKLAARLRARITIAEDDARRLRKILVKRGIDTDRRQWALDKALESGRPDLIGTADAILAFVAHRRSAHEVELDLCPVCFALPTDPDARNPLVPHCQDPWHDTHPEPKA